MIVFLPVLKKFVNCSTVQHSWMRECYNAKMLQF